MIDLTGMRYLSPNQSSRPKSVPRGCPRTGEEVGLMP
jgi:hypothetical protein